MGDTRNAFTTAKSVAECEKSFRAAVKGSYGAGRKVLRALSAVRGDDVGGVEFFTPNLADSMVDGRRPDLAVGAMVPGQDFLFGASKVAVSMYVVDHGDRRQVSLFGPASLGTGGSTRRLLQNIKAKF